VSKAGQIDHHDQDQPVETMWEGRFITAKRQGKWEYVARSRGIKAAVILAIDNGHVLLVEQFRVPLGRNCIELPLVKTRWKQQDAS
jgi:ADP-ribose pyrophosphatase